MECIRARSHLSRETALTTGAKAEVVTKFRRACAGETGRMSPRELPIYELEPAVVASLSRGRGRLVVQAPTGSGKSTQLPQIPAPSRVFWMRARSWCCSPGGWRPGCGEARGRGGGTPLGATWLPIRLDSRVRRPPGSALSPRGILLRQMIVRPGVARNQRAGVRRVSRTPPLR